MSRNYANISTSIWRPENNFGNLTRDGQWAHFMLNTQPDISAAGVLSLNVKRWASRARDTTRTEIVAALQELQEAGMVVYDTETEELLLRTFLKDDGGYSNRKRRPVIERAAGQVESMALRQALAQEFAELDLPLSWLGLPASQGADRLSAPYEVTHPGESSNLPTSPPTVPAPRAPETTFPQVDRLSDALSHSPSDRPSRFDGVVVTEALVVRPQPSTHIPQPVPPPAATAVALADQPSLEGMPEPEPTETTTTDAQRAFGIARWWIDVRKKSGTPVIAKGRNGPLHILKNLIEPFAAGRYADNEIKQALEEISESVPSKAQMDRTLARLRAGGSSNQQGRRNGSLGHQPYRNPKNQDDYNEWTVRR